MTTTPDVIRDSIASRIAAIVPAIHAAQPFIEHREEMPFRAWSAANPPGSLRRFSVRWVGAVAAPVVTNMDLEEVEDEIEIVVAYPTNWRHGGRQLAGLDDVVKADARRISHVVGTNGAAGMAAVTTSATAITLSESVDAGDAVTFGVVRLRVVYTRSPSA